jgi:hypothetical protein
VLVIDILRTLYYFILQIVTGASFEFFGIENILEKKLAAGQQLEAKLMTLDTQDSEDGEARYNIVCSMTVLEFLHCMIGPGFMENC